MSVTSASSALAHAVAAHTPSAAEVGALGLVPAVACMPNIPMSRLWACLL